MRILLTNNTLAHRTGSELYTAELAMALRVCGHLPVIYSAMLGELAEEVASAGVATVDALDGLEPPDLIHGHHHLGTLTALLHFPGVPGLLVCHGYEPWEEAPVLFPRLRRYVAVDLPTAERLTAAGVPPDRLETILNFADIDRFQPRPPLPPRPLRALVFSNNAHDGSHLPVVRAACAQAGIEVDVAGIASGRVTKCPERLLPTYDLVFAKGRAAIEALVVGAAVILTDTAGCGPLVTSAELERLRPLNFGFRTLDRPLSPETVGSQIARYDAEDAARVSRKMREVAGLDKALSVYLDLYSRILAEAGEAASESANDRRAAAAYLAWLDPFLRERSQALIDRAELWRRVQALGAECERLRRALPGGAMETGERRVSRAAPSRPPGAVQARATEMISRHGFLGVPTETFEEAGRNQLIGLLGAGLRPESKVLDLGCGCLRAGYWLIHFLNADCYCGIEPARQRVEHGLAHLFTPEELSAKRPRFDYNADFDASRFGVLFDFLLAGSLWTHASKGQIAGSLDCFLRHSSATGVFLASYLPAQLAADDYQGDRWVGTSNESATPGVIRHAIGWITDHCQQRGLAVKQLGPAFDDQLWLRIERCSLASAVP
jgi:hypothetical protein